MNSMPIEIIVVSIAMAPPWTSSSCLLSCDDHHLHHPCQESPWKHTKLVHLITNEWITLETKHHKSTHKSLYNNGTTSTRLCQLATRRLHKCYTQIITWHWVHTIHIIICKYKLDVKQFLLKLWYHYSRQQRDFIDYIYKISMKISLGWSNQPKSKPFKMAQFSLDQSHWSGEDRYIWL
jgi:hypothetical protein